MQGCQLGRLTADPEILANPDLNRPVEQTFDWLRKRLTEVIWQGVEKGEFVPHLNVEETAAAIAAILPGGYVLAKAAGNDEPFFSAARGMLTLLKSAATGIPVESEQAAIDRSQKRIG